MTDLLRLDLAASSQHNAGARQRRSARSARTLLDAVRQAAVDLGLLPGRIWTSYDRHKTVTTTTFRRAFVEYGTVCVEVALGEVWHMPNPTPAGQRYDPQRVLRAVVGARVVNLEHWRRVT